MALVPWTLLSARASPSLRDLKEATKRREAHGGSPGHLPGEPGALICAERARGDASARAESSPKGGARRARRTEEREQLGTEARR